MLKPRLLVAFLFLPFFIWLIFLPEPTPFFVLLLLSLAVGVVEMHFMFHSQKINFSWWITLSAVLLMGLIAAYAELWPGQERISTFAALWIIFISAGLLLSLREIFRGMTDASVMNISLGLFTVFSLGGIGSFIFLLRRLPYGSWWVLILFGFNWWYDAAAMLSGHFFGRRQLAPSISPAKTCEGLWGGLVANGLLAAVVYAILLPAALGFTWWGFVSLGIGLGFLAQAGDLVESLFKRWAGVKNSAEFIPGHGGILDKIDNTFFTAPFLYALARWLLGI